MLLKEGSILYVRCIQKAGENDLHELQIYDSGHNESTICLVNGRIGAKGMVFERGHMNEHH